MSSLLPSLLPPLPIPTSTIHLTNLVLPSGLLCPDIWSQLRPQPATLSLQLHLTASGFTSASAADALDGSTVHYGTLAKRILAATSSKGISGDGLSVVDAMREVEGIVRELAGRILQRCRVEMGLVKGSMFGEEVRFVKEVRGEDDDGLERFGIEVRNVKVMTLVGVNAYERQGRQPVVVGFSLWTGTDGEAASDGLVEKMLGLERVLVEIVEPTTYETLETLIEYTVTELKRRILDREFPGAILRLKMEKPRAIAWADAPGLEVVREIPRISSGDARGTMDELSIVKPYGG